MTWVELAATSTSSSFKRLCMFSGCFEWCVLYLKYFWLIWNPRKLRHKIRRPGHVFWRAQWLKFLRNWLSEVELGLEGLTWFKEVQYAGKGLEQIFCCLVRQWPVARWIYANRQSQQHWQRKNEEWRSGWSSSCVLERGSVKEKELRIYSGVFFCLATVLQQY